MSSNHAKKLAPFECGPASAGEDRISSLPDELLHRILYFMDIKYAVQTCVLSKRWQSLWRSLPYLVFDFRTFPFNWEPWEGDDAEDEAEGGPMAISSNNFITQLLVRRQHTNLVTVSVCPFWENEFVEGSAIVVERLIAYAVDHNVQQLTIYWEREWEFEWPESFYTCQSLEALYLDNISQCSKFLALPSLKSLHLEDVSLSQSFFHPRNFSGCPNLETLIFSGNVILCEDTTLVINAPNLKRLELSFGWNYSWNRENTCKIVIDAPGLTTFQYCGYAPMVSSSHDLAFIDDAYFHIYYIHALYEDEVAEHVSRAINTLKEFRHAKSLTLSLETVEALAKFPSFLDENRLSFSKLKYLKISLESYYVLAATHGG